ncbi:MAG: helix-turn-helix transcriptional regulator [Clostridia bacterium]|nr:helix-turn-helix transcriptional regulator [Clostridia bacterium]
MGIIIKERREELGMTQEELAAKSNLSRQTISSIETGKYENVTVGTLAAIASALETTVDKIFYPQCPNDLTGGDR